MVVLQELDENRLLLEKGIDRAATPLFTIVDAAILDRLGRRTKGVGRHGKRIARNSIFPSLQLPQLLQFESKKSRKINPLFTLDFL